MYFIRVNGNPDMFFSYYKRCLREGFVRIGWPSVGDLHARDGRDAFSQGYNWHTIQPYQREYLLDFLNIRPGSIILMPDKKRPGVLAIGATAGCYYFTEEGPHECDIRHHCSHPYECAHRINVQWDTDRHGDFIEYNAEEDFRIIPGNGFWRYAYWHLRDRKVTERIQAVRQRKMGA